MKTTVTFSGFTDAFHKMDRYEQFGYQALRVLYDYLENYQEETGQEVELDVIALCCDFSADTPESIAQDYSIDLTDVDEDDIMAHVVDYLNDHTMVCGTTEDGQIVYQQF